MRALLLAGVVAFGSFGVAQAKVIGFDDLPGSGNAISNGYEGLNWSNVDTITPYNQNAPFGVGVVSPATVAFNGFGNMATVSSSTSFTLTSGYFASAYTTQSVSVWGYVNGLATYHTSFTAFDTSVALEAFNWTDLSSFTFAGSNDIQLTLDNLNVTIAPAAPASVPEPASLALLAAGLIGAGVIRRSRTA